MTAANDPAGFLQIAPRLAELMTDDAVRAAVHTGNAEALHKALGAKRQSPQEHERLAAESLLGIRRLFVTPVKKAPSLHTVNGFGTWLRFKSDESPDDGTYIGTLVLTALYLPVFPLGQYLVRAEGGDSYIFLGKVPLSGAMRIWRKIMGAFTALVVASIGLGVYESSQQSKVWLANGLDFPVTVELGERKAIVPPGALDAFEKIKVGPQHLRVTRKGGAVLQELDVDVPRWTDAVVVNVLGAAPIYVESVEYATSGDAPEGTLRMVSGPTLVVEDRVDDVFKDPPTTVRTKGSRVTRWHIALAEGGLATTVNQLITDKRKDDALSILRGILMAMPDDPPEVPLMQLRLFGEPDQTLAFAKAWAEKFPNAIGANRFYQDMLADEDRLEEARAIYVKRMQEHPDDAIAAYLALRLLENDAAFALYKELAPKLKDANVHNAYAARLWSAGRYAEAAEQYEAVRQLNPQKWLAASTLHIRALVATGRAKDAVRIYGEQLAPITQPELIDVAAYFALVKLAGGSAPTTSPESIAARLPDDRARAWASIMAFGTASDAQIAAFNKDPREKTAALIATAAWRSSDEMLARAKGADAETLGHLPPETLLLLAGEAFRKEDDELLDAAFAAPGFPVDEGLMMHYLEEGSEDGFEDVDPQQRAALRVGRARLGKGSRDALYKKALLEDFLQTNVTAAVKNWKK